MVAPRLLLATILLALATAMALSLPQLATDTRVGLEFRGGYEILFVASPLPDGRLADHDLLLQAATVLGQRANRLGVSEPEVVVEGKDQIRVKLAGVSGVAELRKTLLDPAGMPVQLTEKYSQTVGGVLGESDLQDTLMAGGVALLLIFLFMVAVYRLPGAVAVFGLLTYLWALLGAFNLLHATLSLAAIVAFVLGVGIAAGTNILSFEWVKEELRRGKPTPLAFGTGQNKALRTIVDANGTVFIAMAILFAVGPGTVRGFALTMMLSIVVSIVISLFFVRLLLALLYARASERKPFPIGAPKATSGRVPDFLAWRRSAFIGSGAIAAVGVAMLFVADLNYDIDFKAGTALDLKIPAAISQAQATEVIASAGIPPATVAVGGAGSTQIAARFDDVLDAGRINAIVDVFRKSFGPSVAFEENTADPAVARQLAVEAIYAIVLAIAGSFFFILLRFDHRVAIAAILSVVNAVLFVISIFAIFSLEIDVTFIAAMLTVIGYALNESIIVFDRVRQNLREESPGGSPADLLRVLNASVRQTLSRSLYTVLAVVIGAVSLFCLGAEPLQMFSLAIFLGLVCGSFSSIFIAPAAWYRLARRG
jgi:preprotein translocase SecF subunit